MGPLSTFLLAAPLINLSSIINFSSETILGTLWIEPRASGSWSKYANHFAMLPLKLSIVCNFQLSSFFCCSIIRSLRPRTKDSTEAQLRFGSALAASTDPAHPGHPLFVGSRSGRVSTSAGTASGSLASHHHHATDRPTFRLVSLLSFHLIWFPSRNRLIIFWVTFLPLDINVDRRPSPTLLRWRPLYLLARVLKWS